MNPWAIGAFPADHALSQIPLCKIIGIPAGDGMMAPKQSAEKKASDLLS